MNYIKKLENDLNQSRAAIATVLHDLEAWRAFLITSPKFTGNAGGNRKDWIATGDVVRWIDSVRSTVIDNAPACALRGD